MFNRERRKYPEDWDDPIVVTVLTTAGPQWWHPEVLELRKEGLTIRECAKKLGIGFSPIQKFLNPESKRKAKIRQAKMERERRAADPEAMKKRRDYSRKYAQLSAPARWTGPFTPGKNEE